MRIRQFNQEKVVALNSIQMRPASCQRSWSQLSSPAATAMHLASYLPATRPRLNPTTTLMIQDLPDLWVFKLKQFYQVGDPKLHQDAAPVMHNESF